MTEGACLCGAVRWRYDGTPPDATICNCTACRRYGALWSYGWEGETVEVTGPVRGFRRRADSPLEFQFCPDCGCVTSWRATAPAADGRRRLAVNLRLAEPEAVAAIPMLRFDGLDTFEDQPPDGRCVSDHWF